MKKSANERGERRRRPRRRPGRLRRWLLRPAIWALAALALAVLGGWLVLRSDWLEERLARRIELELSARFDREVRFEGLSFTLLPLGVEVTGATIAGLEPDDPPFAAVERLVVEAAFGSLRRREIELQRVVATGPRVALRFGEEGEDNLVHWRRREEREGRSPFRPEIRIGQIAVEGGELAVDDRRLPLDFEARNLRARLLGLGELEVQGQLQAEDVSVLLPGGRPYLGALAAKVRIDPEGLEVLNARVSGPDLDAAARGAWSWREEKSLALDVDARGETALLERLGYLEGLMEGPFRFDGGFAWRPESWGYRGRVESPRLTVLDRRLEGVEGVLSGDRGGLRFDLERAGYGGGAVGGAVIVDTGGGATSVALDLKLDAVRLERLLADQEIPVTGVDGRVSGGFTYEFAAAEPRLGEGWADLRIAAEPEPRPGSLRVTGTAPLAIQRGVLRSRALRLVSAAQRIESSGTYDIGRAEGRFDYRIDSDRIAELFRLVPLPAPGEPVPPWLPATGSGVVEGTLAIAAGGVTTDLTADLFGVDAEGYHAERLQGSMRLGAAGVERLRLELLREEGAIIVTGSVPFGEAAPPSPGFFLAVEAVGWPLADLAVWMPLELPVDGRVGGHLELGGRPEAPAGVMDVALRPAVVSGLDVDALELRMRFDPERVAIEELRLAAEAGEVRLAGEVPLAGEGLSLALESSPLDLAREPLAALGQGRLAGTLTVVGRIAGSLERPAVDADLGWADLALAGRRLGENGDASTRVLWDGEELRAEGSLLGLVRFEGGGRLDREGAALELAVSSSRLADLAALALPEPTEEFSGSFAGRLTAGADFTAGGEIALGLELQRLEARFRDHALANLEPVRLRLDGDTLILDSVFLGEEGGTSEVFLAGRVLLDGSNSIELNLQSTLDTAWFGVLLPDLELRGGTFDAIASIGGTLAEPRLNGVGELAGARLLLADLPYSFDELRGVALFYPEQLVIDSARARFAGGSVLAGGSVRLRGPDAPGYRLQFSGRGLSVRYPEGWLLRGDAEVVLSSTPEGRQVRGTVDLDRAFYLQDVELGLGALLQALFERRRLEVEETSELLATTQLGVQVSGERALRIRNNLANLEGSADLSLRGSLARPVVFGKVELVPGGTVVYADSDYVVQRGLLTFANPYRIEPVVDLVATTDRRDYDVTLNLSGSLDRLNATFSSDPPLADLEVLALLTGGVGLPASGAGVAGTSSVGAEGFLYGQAASLITRRVNRLFGLDKLRIDPLTSSTGSLSSARVTVGKRLSRDLTATYSYDPTSTEQQVLEMEWHISRSLVLVVTQNGDNTYAVDARWEKAF